MEDTPERVSVSTVQLSAFVAPELREAMLIKAEKNDRTLSAEIRRALKEYLVEEPAP
jgi:hypothetical protein